MLNLMLTNGEQLFRDVKMRSSVGCSDHEIVELRILRGGHKTKGRIMTLDVRRQTLTSSESCLEESYQEEFCLWQGYWDFPASHSVS